MLLLYTILALLVIGGIAHPRTRWLFIERAPEPKALPPHDEDKSLDEWKEVFRETVIAAEGKLSRDMELFLAGEEDKIIAQLVKEKLERDKPAARTVLSGSAAHELGTDVNACTTQPEQVTVVRRWHDKGYFFSPNLRDALLKSATAPETRTAYRLLFDEQDRDRERSGLKYRIER